jgi:hypothetical protein
VGESIDQVVFSKDDEIKFAERLREETKILKSWFDQRYFDYSEKPSLGLEIEAWLVDENHIPTPRNKEFLETCNDSMLFEELAQYNFELNTEPEVLQPGCLESFRRQIEKTWKTCREGADKMGVQPMMVGIHPLVRDQMLQPQYLSHDARYDALNRALVKLRKKKEIEINIKGFDHFQMTTDHVTLEAAATSIQIHISANQEDARRVYNASQIVATPTVAVAANSPYLYGHDLWSESRIPVFEQAISAASFRDKKGRDVGRVTFGTGYIRRSFLEIFLENLDGYPPMIPILFDDAPENLHHLRFHNGTIWRWNRPIIGFAGGKPHLRVEQRPLASGPTIVDIVANAAFSVGLTMFYSRSEKAPEESMTFTDCYNNFYKAAKHGLSAEVRWFGRSQRLDKVILDDLIPKAKLGLQLMGLEQEEIRTYIDDIIQPRVMSGQNGARWQRAFIETHGRDFQALAEAYFENQLSGVPVHKWKA